MKGHATAPAAGTILSPLANGFGSAFAIDMYSTATVELNDSGSISSEVSTTENGSESLSNLSERCLEACIETVGDNQGGSVYVETEVPLNSGLNATSATANAVVLATVDALGMSIGEGSAQDTSDTSGSHESRDSLPLIDVAKLAVTATEDSDVIIPSTFDSATASLFGGITVTDNIENEIIQRDQAEWDVLVWLPAKLMSGEIDYERCKRLTIIADQILELIQKERYTDAMMLNGFAFSSALRFPSQPIVEALPLTNGVTVSGTGPSYIAVGKTSTLEKVRQYWELRKGSVVETAAVRDGAQIV
ncbi:shikimate kinase [Natrinema versiforme]|uniref:Shikimate kinase n=1 Tax=Natrinema versiforme TaxID=88724 RepID=A0A4P8WNB0_9EURY|nr:shikimate kinase [Natrinema versiforme]QCS44980.1 shikimate kinase [Natrinema versiforme]